MKFDQTTCEEVANLEAAADAVQLAALGVHESRNLTDHTKTAMLRELKAMHERIGRFAQLANDAETLGRKLAASGVAHG